MTSETKLNPDALADLYEALDQLVGRLDPVAAYALSMFSDGCSGADMADRIIAAKAALAKARGES